VTSVALTMPARKRSKSHHWSNQTHTQRTPKTDSRDQIISMDKMRDRVNRRHPQRSRRRSTRRAGKRKRLTTETVEGTALALKSVNDVEGGDGLALGVLSVGDGIANDALKEGLEHTAGLFVDHCDDVSTASMQRQGKATY
jgi:hypothetical protein